MLDYSAYADVPAAKTIIQAMVAGGYGQKIIDLGKQKRSFLASLMKSNPSFGKPEGDEWINKLKLYSSIISKQNGFQQPLVDYVIGCMVYGLDWIDDAPDGKDGAVYGKYQGLCLETQVFPNFTKYSHFPGGYLKGGEKYDTITKYAFSKQ